MFHFRIDFFIYLSKLVNYCDVPGSIENGQMKGSPPFTCISTVIYTCDKEYWLLGPETLRCGIDGRWNNVKPICVNKG